MERKEETGRKEEGGRRQLRKKQDLNQRRMTYLQNMLSYINQALDLVQKRHSEDGVPQTSCPGTGPG